MLKLRLSRGEQKKDQFIKWLLQIVDLQEMEDL
jgi:hypothetical protein